MSSRKTKTEDATLGVDTSQAKKAKILLVDDTPENLVALEATLSTLDEDLVLAHSGTEALRYLLEDDFAAVLLDVRMPVMDGFETAQLIRNRQRSRHIPILFLSKYKSDGQLLRGYDLGAVDFLSMPIVPQVLRSKVSVFVQLHRNATLLREQALVLQKAEQKFRSLLEAAPDAMIMCHEDGGIALVNSRAESMFDYKREEMVGKKIQVLVPEWRYQIPVHSDQTSGVARSHESGIECLAVRQDGDGFPAEIATSLLQAEDGVLITTSIRDITDRKRTEQQIRELDTYKQLAHGLDLTHTMIRDMCGEIRFWTKGAQELYGWTADEAIGAISYELLRAELPERLEQIEDKLRKENHWQGELKLYSKVGREIFVASHWALHYSEAGKAPRVIEVNNDISERKVVEEHLRESEERFRKVFEESPLGKAFVRPDVDRFVRVNPAFARMLGYQVEDFAKLTMSEITHPEDRNTGREEAELVFRGELPSAHFESRYVTKNAAVVWASVHVALIPDMQGRPLYNLVIVEDMTARKQMQEELCRVNEELTQFSSIAAHDLQTPLRNIRTSVQMLAKRYQDERQLDPMMGGTERMQQLIETLLAFAREDKTLAKKQALQVALVVEEALVNLKSELQETAAEIIYDALPVIESDPVQLSQIFQNLIGNALKYRGKERPRITITAKKQDHNWLFSVRDNGIGIPTGQCEAIFLPLKRLHGPEVQGNGIGLAICKRIVERSGGHIWVESQVGQGSTFHFTLPTS